MTETEIKKLIKLLKKLKEDGLAPPKTPLSVWKELATILPAPAVEVLVTKNGKDFLLTLRNDEYWQGWHIPGGFMLAKESVEQACSRIAQKEIGIDVRLKRVKSVHTWEDHPYASAISIICVCKPKGRPNNGNFFTQIPKETISQHKSFLKNFLDDADQTQ